MITGKEFAHEFGKAFTEVFRGQYLHADNTLCKWIDGQYLCKPSVQMKDLRIIWHEDAVKTPELIDPVFYNLDGSRKTDDEIQINLGIKYPSVQFTGLTKKK